MYSCIQSDLNTGDLLILYKRMIVLDKGSNLLGSGHVRESSTKLLPNVIK